ncbi:MAG: hypothetical protein JSU81_01640 [Candidatus Coatesbacteria bacterium]|nr:MAG: hypothetical protein JSU81_01640 [Candidatus Coatesbacteria bacterium]
MGRYYYLAAAAFWLASACSNVDGPSPPGNGSDPLYYPNGDGSSWSYTYQRYFNNVPFGDPTEYAETFDGSVVVGGRTAQRLARFTPGLDEYQLFFLADDEKNVVAQWGREFYVGGRLTGAVYFDPAWNFLLYPLRVNRSWSEAKQLRLSPLGLGLPADVDNDGRDDTVDVEIVCHVVTKEDLTIPLGTFEGCYKLRRTIYATFHMTSGGEAEITYVRYAWFKPNKGFVQYTGDEIYVPNGARYTFLAQLKSYRVVEPSRAS